MISGTVIAVLMVIALAGSAAWAIYRLGRKKEQNKQLEISNEILKKQRDLASEPRPGIDDDRNSMRNGEF